MIDEGGKRWGLKGWNNRESRLLPILIPIGSFSELFFSNFIRKISLMIFD